MKTLNYTHLEEKGANTIVLSLQQLLADFQIHYANLRGFHWNIKGKSFFTLHSVFEKYYDQAAEREDEIAERILMLGGTPMHTYQDYLDNSSLLVYQNVSNADKAVTDILSDINRLIKSQRELIEVAGAADDEVTVDMMIGFTADDEKKVWMLSAYMG